MAYVVFCMAGCAHVVARLHPAVSPRLLLRYPDPPSKCQKKFLTIKKPLMTLLFISYFHVIRCAWVLALWLGFQIPSQRDEGIRLNSLQMRARREDPEDCDSET